MRNSLALSKSGVANGKKDGRSITRSRRPLLSFSQLRPSTFSSNNQSSNTPQFKLLQRFLRKETRIWVISSTPQLQFQLPWMPIDIK